MISFIDHYDSFSFNVIDWLASAAPVPVIERIAYDDGPAMLKLLKNPRPLVISPGPGVPADYPQTLELVNSLWGRVPVLGICLGHQILAHLAGASVRPLPAPFHGTTKLIGVTGTTPLFAGMPRQFKAASYNSLTIDSGDLADAEILATSSDGELQAVQYATEPPVIGLQFHPESFLSECADLLATNWLGLVGAYCAKPRTTI